jgi:hypothetical protein
VPELGSLHARAPRLFGAWILWFVAASCAATTGDGSNARQLPASRGPLPERANGPLVQTFLVLRPRTAATTTPGDVDLRIESAYSSIFEVGNGTLGSVSFDGELWRTSAMVRTGLGPRTDFEIEVPVVYATSGFLDVFIETWHSILGLPDSGRDLRPQFDYDMRVEAGDVEAYSMEGNSVGLGDVPLVVTHRIVDARGASPAVFVQGALEIPVGSEADGFGNGEFDWGLGVGLESDLGDWILGGGIGWTDRRRSSSFARADLPVDDGWALHTSAEWRAHHDWSLLVGLRFENAVTESLEIEELSGEVLELDLGVAIDGAGSTRWLVGFSEDVIAASGPDFTAFLGFQVAF